jgi:hypothetical protein
MQVSSRKSRRPRWLIIAAVILVAGISLAIRLPDGYICPPGTHLHEQHRHLNYQSFFRDCLLNDNTSAPVLPYNPISPNTDSRTPLRVAIVGISVALATKAPYLALRRRVPSPEPVPPGG